MPTRRKSNILAWTWLFLIAPGRVVMLHSPYPPAEVLQRLRTNPKVAQVTSPTQIMIRLPGDRNERRFFAWIEADATGTRISGQTKTPYRVALIRSLISLVMYGLAFLWLAEARLWLGILFVAGGTGFLVLSQYERLTGFDVRRHLDWLRRALDAQ